MALDHPGASATPQGGLYGFAVTFAFPVLFTRGLLDPSNPILADSISRLEPARRHRALFIVDAAVAEAHPSLITDIRSYAAAHAPVLELACDPLVIAGSEPAKNDLNRVIPLLRVMDEARLDRQSFVVVIGGGAVLDVASLAAALAHRGIRTIRVPTTVLAQDDSGIAVKTSVNMFGKKNFAGTFTPPFAVLVDFDFLETLSRRDRIAGLSEAVKVALLRDPALFDFIESNAAALAEGERPQLEHVVRTSAELHLAHICGGGDPFEFGSARPLDFGHWAAHKLESVSCHRIRHGEAVSIGIALDVLYAARTGLLRQSVADRVVDVLESLGLPTWDDALGTPGPGGTPEILRGLQEFREHLGGELHVTMVRDVGQGVEVTSIDETQMRDAIGHLRDRGEARAAVRLRTSRAR